MTRSLETEATFHEGEVALQEEAGVSERFARLGPQMIRSYMPQQHREFFELLPFVVVGSLDGAGQSAASLLCGPPGFVTAPDEHTLRVNAAPLPGSALDSGLRAGAALALLGIQAHTRRRNRANGVIRTRDEHGFELEVRQSFGNCPKYIWPREARFSATRVQRSAPVAQQLDRNLRRVIETADTFYIASAHPEANLSGARSHGLDVSHRGGPRGFIHFTSDSTFIIPDFRGNQFFNTLGNLRLYPSAGLLFIDYASASWLELDVRAESATEPHPLHTEHDTGRVLRFEVRGARFAFGAVPLTFSLGFDEP